MTVTHALSFRAQREISSLRRIPAQSSTGRIKGLYCGPMLIYKPTGGRVFMATRWLFKTEPSVYSYQQLVKDKSTRWDGVANNLALMHLKDIKKGDQIFIYHTGDEKQAVGIARALGGAYSDPEKDNPRMLVVDIEPVKALAKPVTLAQVKADKKLAKFDLVRNSRLSIMKLTEEQWDAMIEMSKK
jgi:predicted RNA-binding protein with PUA-like domain